MASISRLSDSDMGITLQTGFPRADADGAGREAASAAAMLDTNCPGLSGVNGIKSGRGTAYEAEVNVLQPNETCALNPTS